MTIIEYHVHCNIYFHTKTTAFRDFIFFIAWTRYIPTLCVQYSPLTPRISLFAVAFRQAVEVWSPVMEWVPEKNGWSVNLTTQFRLVSRSKTHGAWFKYTSSYHIVSYLDLGNFRFSIWWYTVNISEQLAVRQRWCSGNLLQLFHNNRFSNLVEDTFGFMKFSEINYRRENPGKFVSFQYIQRISLWSRTQASQCYAMYQWKPLQTACWSPSTPASQCMPICRHLTWKRQNGFSWNSWAANLTEMSRYCSFD